ncbi:MAG: 2-oxoacid:ferredoxin oxidoreductase subunit beta [Planctomycetes bacterium RBG_16_59_8]|nr:MAG: 2-oxoacid:ferredoxin oxidoreductase subunit beta [Planctomycetes bacterium RBG_16_59_8]
MNELHPSVSHLREDRLPHIWCPGCGIGTTVNTFSRALEDAGYNEKNICIVSGIGCTGRTAGYVNFDSFHTTHGRPIPFATGLKLANPDMKVVVYSGDGDLFAIGGNHFIHAARRNMDMTVICINNFIYAMTSGQAGPTTPLTATATTAPYGCYEPSFNLPYLADSCGAVYVARWTAYHVSQLVKSMGEALKKKGFSFIEILSPCPTYYERRNKLGEALDRMSFYRKNSVIRNGADTRETDIEYQKPIVLGKFVDREKPSYIEMMHQQMQATLKDRYVAWKGPNG